MSCNGPFNPSLSCSKCVVGLVVGLSENLEPLMGLSKYTWVGSFIPESYDKCDDGLVV